MKNRSRVDIVAAILEAAEHGKMKTRIMYDARVSFLQLNEYLLFLMEREMVEHLPEENLYRSTEAGKLFLESYHEIWHILHQSKRKKKEGSAIPVAQKSK